MFRRGRSPSRRPGAGGGLVRKGQSLGAPLVPLPSRQVVHDGRGRAKGPYEGFAAYNIRGQTIEVSDFLATIGEVATSLDLGKFVDLGIAEDASENLFVSDLDDSAMAQRFPTVPKTPLTEGIERSLRRFQQLAGDGALELTS